MVLYIKRHWYSYRMSVSNLSNILFFFVVKNDIFFMKLYAIKIVRGSTVLMNFTKWDQMD